MDGLSNVRRLYLNIQTLLAKGTFPGEFAAALAEAQQFIATIVVDVEREINDKDRTEAGTSDRPAENPTGVAGGEVVPPKRKGSARRKDRA